MEKKDMHTAPIQHPEGVEVKLSAKSVNIKSIASSLILFILGTCLFVYIWEELSFYNIGYQLGTFAKQFKGMTGLKILLAIALLCVFYTFIQTAVLYLFSGKDRKKFRWQSDAKAIGFALTCPIALKYYRVSLLLPGILLGILPTIHGFCTGNTNVFYWGMVGLLGASGDFLFWYKLRAFDEEDLIRSNKECYDATIIKRTQIIEDNRL